MREETLRELADRLVRVDGVVSVVLGGSRARGTHRPDSDTDLGLYYHAPLDVTALRRLAAEVSDEPVEVSEPGRWGPWVDGGAWLTIGGQRVDWIYRNLDRVRRVWDDCRQGRYEVGRQPGHPLGFYSHAYAGEVALCRPLADPDGHLGALRGQVRTFPPALGQALVDGIWEADFAVGGARYGATGADPTFAAGCLFRSVGVLCHALHGHARQWLINEKGMVAATGRLACAPDRFTDRAHRLLAKVGSSPADIAATVSAAAELVAEVRASVNEQSTVQERSDGTT